MERLEQALLGAITEWRSGQVKVYALGWGILASVLASAVAVVVLSRVRIPS